MNITWSQTPEDRFSRDVAQSNFLFTVETAYNVVRLADEYQIPDLLERCDAVLSKSIRSDVQTSDIYFNLKVAHTYNLRKLQARCIELASERPLAEMMDNKKKHEIPSDIQEIILSRGLRRHELDIIECKWRNVSE